MVIDFNDLRKYDFEISEVDAIHQRPKYRRLVSASRLVNGFLVILHGYCRYIYEGGEFSLAPNSVVYLPIGSKHVFEIDSEDIEFIRIDFKLKIGGELTLFSKMPKKLSNAVSKEGLEAVRVLADVCRYSRDSVRKTELICTIFRSLYSNYNSERKERLAPAISYLIEHLTGDADCSELAKLCHLSSSQFYNLFREEYKLSPLAYRNSLLIKKAKMLLQDMNPVTAVAELLGFDSVSYFSRFFKKQCGISPEKYRRSLVNGDAF